jgi:hypothetical protein
MGGTIDIAEMAVFLFSLLLYIGLFLLAVMEERANLLSSCCMCDSMAALKSWL